MNEGPQWHLYSGVCLMGDPHKCSFVPFSFFFLKQKQYPQINARSSSREVRIRVPFFWFVYLSGGSSPKKETVGAPIAGGTKIILAVRLNSRCRVAHKKHGASPHIGEALDLGHQLLQRTSRRRSPRARAGGGLLLPVACGPQPKTSTHCRAVE